MKIASELGSSDRSTRFLLLCLAAFPFGRCNSLRPQQNPLGIAGEEQYRTPSAATTTLELAYVEGWLYTTQISIGTPSQEFTAALDIGWSDLFVPSTRCPQLDRPEYCAPHPLYNSTRSETSVPDGRNTSVHHFGFYTQGNAVSDSVQVGSLTSRNQTFEEAYLFRPTYGFDDTWYDTALGLSLHTLRSEESNLQASSLFQNMMAQGLLEKNVFCISLPISSNETGRLALGHVPADLDGHPKEARLPLDPMNSPRRYRIGTPSEPMSAFDSQVSIRSEYLSGGWQVSGQSITFGHGPVAPKLDLSDYTIVFSTIDFWISLPTKFGRQVREKLGVSVVDGSIDCKERDATHQNLTMTLKGKNELFHEFLMTPREYIRSEPKIPFVDPDRCLVPIALHKEDEMDKFVVLGSIFLQKYHLIFDADARVISFIQRT